MPYSIEKLDPSRKYGVVIKGLAPTDLKDEAVRSELRKLWIEHGLINFKAEPNAAFHVALSEVFGELEAHPVKEYQHKSDPRLLSVLYDPEKTDIWEVNGKQLGAWLPWHSDLIFMDRINRGGILRPATLPGTGGETAFIDKIEAYERLPESLRRRIDGRYVIYRMQIDPATHRYVANRNKIRLVRTHPRIEDVRVRQDRDYPPVAHPMEYTQRETGRKVLNVSPAMALYIYGMDAQESHELLEQIVDHLANEQFAYRHRWAGDDMLLWDNWRVIHSACGMEPTQRREMLRTTISGDYQLGMKLSELEGRTAAQGGA